MAMAGSLLRVGEMKLRKGDFDLSLLVVPLGQRSKPDRDRGKSEYNRQRRRQGLGMPMILVIASTAGQALTGKGAEISGERGNMRWMLVGFSLLVAGTARAEVPEAALEPIAEIVAIRDRCGELRINDPELRRYFASIGLAEDLDKAPAAYRDYMTMRAAEFTAQLRALSEDGVCAKGRYLYGADGTKIRGLLQLR